MGNESLSNRELTIILLTTITVLLKPTITTEEKHTEYYMNLPFQRTERIESRKSIQRKYTVGVDGNRNAVLLKLLLVF